MTDGRHCPTCNCQSTRRSGTEAMSQRLSYPNVPSTGSYGSPAVTPTTNVPTSSAPMSGVPSPRRSKRYALSSLASAMPRGESAPSAIQVRLSSPDKL
jgi:hypothetical protein